MRPTLASITPPALLIALQVAPLLVETYIEPVPLLFFADTSQPALVLTKLQNSIEGKIPLGPATELYVTPPSVERNRPRSVAAITISGWPPGNATFTSRTEVELAPNLNTADQVLPPSTDFTIAPPLNPAESKGSPSPR